MPIEPGARAIHGITNEQLFNAPSFAEVLPELWHLLEHRTVIIYNANFDLSRFDTSLMSIYPYPTHYDEYCEQSRRLQGIWSQAHCAMEWFAVIYGEKHKYYRTYTWQTLSTACAYFAIPLDNAHDATSDARVTALLVHEMVKLAEQELPPGYHPSRDEPCTGGCGKVLGPFSYEEDKTWYCAECGLTAGLNRLCPLCKREGRRTYPSTNVTTICAAPRHSVIQ